MTWHLVRLAQDPAAPAVRLTVGDDGRILARDHLDSVAASAAAGMRTVLVVPGTAAPAFWLPLPTHNPVQALAAAHALVEDRLAAGHRDAHLAMAPRAGGDGEWLLVAVDPATVRDWLGRAARLGVVPAVLLPDHLALPQPDDDRVLVVEDGGDWIVRGTRQAFRAEAVLAARVLEDRLQRRVVNLADAESLLVAGASAPAIDLLQGAFARGDAPVRGARAWKRAALLAAALALSPLLLWAAEAARCALAARALERQVAARIDAALPGRDRSQPALEAMRAQVAHLRARDAFAGTASVLFAAIAQVDGVQLEALAYAPDGTLRATLAHAEADAGDRVRERIADGGHVVEPTGSRRADGMVYSELLLRPREAAP